MNGELPEGWVTAPAAEVCTSVQSGGTPRGKPFTPTGDIPFLKVYNIVDQRIDFESKPQFIPRDVHLGELRKSVVLPEDVLMNIVGPPLGKIARVPSDYPEWNINQAIVAYRVGRRLDSKFLCYYLREGTEIARIANEYRGSAGQTNISLSQARSFGIPVPPLTEQRRIVEKVEALLTDVNAARDRLAKVPLILKRFRQAVLAAACSGRLTEEWRDTHSQAESGDELLQKIWSARRQRAKSAGEERPRSGTLGRKPLESEWGLAELPPGWTWGRWDDLADWITYGFTRPMPHVTQGIPIVTARHIVSSRIDFETVDLTTQEAFAALSEKDRPRRGEILVTKDGSIGRAAIVETDLPFCINQSVAVIRFGGMTLDPEYMLRVIESPATQHLIDEGAKGSAIRHISITAFGCFPVPVPPLDEQRAIVLRVQELFALVDTIEERLKLAIARADKLPQSILSKAFRGELVPTDAELARAEGQKHEAAEEMVARLTNGQERRAPKSKRRKTVTA